MSFGDINPSGVRSGSMARRQSGGSTVNLLSNELQDFQRVYLRLRDEVSKIRGGSTSTSVKVELDKDIKNLKAMEARIKNQLEGQQKQLENIPRSEIAQRRIALAKLAKDFDRIRGGLSQLVQEVSRLRVNDKLAANESSSAMRGSVSGSAMGHGGMENTVFRMDGNGKQAKSAKASSDRGGTTQGGNLQGQELQFTAVVQGQDVDDLIAEEREREILKMNQDLKMVNEMFKDMADIVQEQGEVIQTVAETTENSNSRAKAGLKQVEQAAGYQSGCVVV